MRENGGVEEEGEVKVLVSVNNNNETQHHYSRWETAVASKKTNYSV